MNRKVLIGGLLLVLPMVGLLLLSLTRTPNQVASPLIGKPAPKFALTPVGGGASVALESLKGKPAILNFWATWCAPCIQEHPLLTAAARRAGDRVRFLGVMYEDEEPKIQAFLAERGSSYPTLADPEGKTAIAFGVYGVPETFFLDAEGRVAAKFEGALTPEMLEELLKRAGGSLR